MKPIHQLVAESLDQVEVLRTAKEQRILRKWDSVVGPVLASRCRPERYDQGTVWVAVEGSAWAQELRMLESQILSKLGAAAGDYQLFENLRFGVRPLPPEFEITEKRKVVDQPELANMTIQEIAERRLKRMRDEEGA